MGKTEPDWWTATININNIKINFKLDTGAEINVLPNKIYKKLSPRPELKKTSISLRAYNNTEIPTLGKCTIKLNNKNIQTHATFIIADINSKPVLSARTCEELNLIKRIFKINNESDSLQGLVEKCDDCFGEIGTLLSTHHITLNEDIKPVIHPPRTVPFALKAKLKAELRRMTKLGIIQPIKDPTDFL